LVVLLFTVGWIHGAPGLTPRSGLVDFVLTFTHFSHSSSGNMTPPNSKKSKKTDTSSTTVTVHHCEDGDDEIDHHSELTGTTDPSTPPSRASSSRSSSKLTLDENVLKKDTLILSTYVKEEMYYGVKFLYDTRHDLAIGGDIFSHFYRSCKNRFEGVKKYAQKHEKELYIRYLWKHCIDERIQQDTLSLKRSSVYTVMQNRFFCKCTAG